MNLNAFAKSNLAWVWNYLATLSRIASVASVQQIIIVKFVLGMAVLRREVIDVPYSPYKTPLLAPEAEHTAKAEFVA